jgi:hypothetical protein
MSLVSVGTVEHDGEVVLSPGEKVTAAVAKGKGLDVDALVEAGALVDEDEYEETVPQGAIEVDYPEPEAGAKSAPAKAEDKK